MDISVTLARIIGPLFVLVSAGTLLNSAHYRRLIGAFLQQPALYYSSGVLAFVTGAALVLYHNLWVADWRVIITVIGWMSLLKGAVRVLFPAAGMRIAATWVEAQWLLACGAATVGVVGAVLTFQGFAG